MNLPAHVVTAGAVLLAFLGAALVVRIGHTIVRRLLDRLEIVSAEDRTAVQARSRQVTRALQLLVYGVASLVSISFALGRLGIAELQWHPRVLARWFLGHGINLILTVLGAYIVVRAAHLAVGHLQYRLGKRREQADLEWQRRAKTLGGILTNLVTVAVSLVAVLMALEELSIDVLPILTGAGIVGLAIGFGAQNLVRDVIAGFFMILEDQVRVGDLAHINGVPGIVEQINLRTIVVRDGEGAVHVFPNGTVTALANLSKQFAYAIVEVRVAYSENIDRVIGTIREVGASMERDPAWSAVVLAPIEAAGVESLGDGLATIRVRLKALPLNQDKVGNELRKRLMAAFVGRGIRPYAG